MSANIIHKNENKVNFFLRMVHNLLKINLISTVFYVIIKIVEVKSNFVALMYSASLPVPMCFHRESYGLVI